MPISDWSSDVCSSDLSFVIPFGDEDSDGGVFWSNADDHAIAHSSLAEINVSPALKTMHNGASDCSYFIRDLCPPRTYLYDSMLLWYSRFSDFPKTLLFLSTILLDAYQNWKEDRNKVLSGNSMLGS